MPIDGFVPFDPERAARYRDAGYWTGRPVDALLRDAAASWPGRLAVVDTEAGHSYAELEALADRTAADFAARGIVPGDRVLLALPNSVSFAVALFGLLRAGAIPVLCLPGHRAAELGHFAGLSGAVGIVTGDHALARQVAADHPALQHLIGVDQLSTAPPGASPPRLPVDTAAPALLLVSGGTTGLPKLIPRTHDDYVYNATASAAVCRLSGDDVYLVALPAAHNFPLACPGLLGAVSVGATTVFTADPSPEAAFAAIARHAVTVTALVPALAKLWAAACEWEPTPPATLRLLQVGGAKLAADDARAVRDNLTPGLQQVFGMAEGLLNYTRLDDPPEKVERTQGRPLCADDELRVIDEDGAEVPDGAEGELLVRGPYTINGYFNAPADNARSFTADGFYRTGDRVRRDADGYLEVTGRVKDVILRGGETIAAADIEEHLLTHPGIRAVAAVALPDDYLGERVGVAAVFAGAPATLAELNAHLTDRGVAAHTRCDVLLVLPTLPVTAVGKVDKKAIAALIS